MQRTKNSLPLFLWILATLAQIGAGQAPRSSAPMSTSTKTPRHEPKDLLAVRARSAKLIGAAEHLMLAEFCRVRAELVRAQSGATLAETVLALRVLRAAEAAFADCGEMPTLDLLRDASERFIGAARKCRDELVDALEVAGKAVVAHDLGAAARFLQEQQDLQMMTDERLCMWFRSERDSWKAAQPARVEQPRKTWWEPVGLKEASELEAAIQSDPVLWRNGKDRMNAGPEMKRAIEQFFELMRVVRRGPGNRQALEESLTQTIATLEKAPATYKTKENSPLAHRMLETLKDLRERNSRP